MWVIYRQLPYLSCRTETIEIHEVPWLTSWLTSWFDIVFKRKQNQFRSASCLQGCDQLLEGGVVDSFVSTLRLPVSSLRRTVCLFLTCPTGSRSARATFLVWLGTVLCDRIFPMSGFYDTVGVVDVGLAHRVTRKGKAKRCTKWVLFPLRRRHGRRVYAFPSPASSF